MELFNGGADIFARPVCFQPLKNIKKMQTKQTVNAGGWLIFLNILVQRYRKFEDNFSRGNAMLFNVYAKKKTTSLKINKYFYHPPS